MIEMGMDIVTYWLFENSVSSPRVGMIDCGLTLSICIVYGLADSFTFVSRSFIA